MITVLTGKLSYSMHWLHMECQALFSGQLWATKIAGMSYLSVSRIKVPFQVTFLKISFFTYCATEDFPLSLGLYFFCHFYLWKKLLNSDHFSKGIVQTEIPKWNGRSEGETVWCLSRCQDWWWPRYSEQSTTRADKCLHLAAGRNLKSYDQLC